ncbi:hypothetical protein L6R50_15275 [Myxococcota bacterium]|nr:hypothetical protein [Myxococcota bacterium]
MIRRLLAVSALGLGVLLGSATPAAATTLHPFTDHELAWVADVVVVGTVESVGSALSGRGRHPYTYTTIRVEEAMKGGAAPGSTVVVREVGGDTPDGGHAFVPASARFDVGERVLVFLEPAAEDGAWRCVGMFQGKYTLRADRRSGRTVAYRVHENDYSPAYDHEARPIPAGAVDAESLLGRFRRLASEGAVPPEREIPGLRADRRAEFRAYWGLPPEEDRP